MASCSRLVSPNNLDCPNKYFFLTFVYSQDIIEAVCLKIIKDNLFMDQSKLFGLNTNTFAMQNAINYLNAVAYDRKTS